MWIELTDDCLPALEAKGWQVTSGALIAPDGMRLPMSKGRATPTNENVLAIQNAD